MMTAGSPIVRLPLDRLPDDLRRAWEALAEKSGCDARNTTHTHRYGSWAPAVCQRPGYMNIRGLSVCNQHYDSLRGDASAWLRVMIAVEVVDAKELADRFTADIGDAHGRRLKADQALRETRALHSEPQTWIQSSDQNDVWRDWGFQIIGERWYAAGVGEDHSRKISNGDQVFCDLYVSVEDGYRLGLAASREMDIIPVQAEDAVIALLTGQQAQQYGAYGVKPIGVAVEKLEPGDRPEPWWGQPAEDRQLKVIVPASVVQALETAAPSLDQARAAMPAETSSAARDGMDDSGYGLIAHLYEDELCELEGAIDVALAGAECPAEVRAEIVRYLSSLAPDNPERRNDRQVFNDNDAAVFVHFLNRFNHAAKSQRDEERTAEWLKERREELARGAARLAESSPQVEIEATNDGRIAGTLTVTHRGVRYDAVASLEFDPAADEPGCEELQITRDDGKRVHHTTRDAIEGTFTAAATKFVSEHPGVNREAALALEHAAVQQELAEVEARAAELRARAAELGSAVVVQAG